MRAFGLRVVEAAAGRVGVVKPQVAFYERYGSKGFAALEDVMAAARAAGLLVIADAKRGDIGTTMDGYARAWLEPGAPLEADAVTLTPYLGAESLRDTLSLACGTARVRSCSPRRATPRRGRCRARSSTTPSPSAITSTSQRG